MFLQVYSMSRPIGEGSESVRPLRPSRVELANSVISMRIELILNLSTQVLQSVLKYIAIQLFQLVQSV